MADNFRGRLAARDIGAERLYSTSIELAKPVSIKAFRKFCLPAVIRSDNGTPFASIGLARLTRLSAWWIQFGIRPETIEPGKPQQNVRHE